MIEWGKEIRQQCQINIHHLTLLLLLLSLLFWNFLKIQNGNKKNYSTSVFLLLHYPSDEKKLLRQNNRYHHSHILYFWITCFVRYWLNFFVTFLNNEMSLLLNYTQNCNTLITHKLFRLEEIKLNRIDLWQSKKFHLNIKLFP